MLQGSALYSHRALYRTTSSAPRESRALHPATHRRHLSLPSRMGDGSQRPLSMEDVPAQWAAFPGWDRNASSKLSSRASSETSVGLPSSSPRILRTEWQWNSVRPSLQLAAWDAQVSATAPCAIFWPFSRSLEEHCLASQCIMVGLPRQQLAATPPFPPGSCLLIPQQGPDSRRPSMPQRSGRSLLGRQAQPTASVFAAAAGAESAAASRDPEDDDCSAEAAASTQLQPETVGAAQDRTSSAEAPLPLAPDDTPYGHVRSRKKPKIPKPQTFTLIKLDLDEVLMRASTVISQDSILPA